MINYSPNIYSKFILSKVCLLLILLFHSFSSIAQIENVFVEIYYVSDSIDATDTTGGVLEKGSKTYRIYVDLKPGSRLKKIYGDANHALKFSSTDSFFNNTVDGQSFGKDFAKNRLGENTVALDTWLTLGQTTKIAAKTYFGIPKPEDTDGSFIGGTNNDGGSAGISSGLLTNTDVMAGIPITVSDGLDTMMTLPTSWADYGFKDIISGEDSTIFGSIKSSNQFISYNAGLQNSGTKGVVADSNKILVAQLTTKGEITFELNLEVEETDGLNTNVIKYVANDSVLLPAEKFNRLLKYPYVQKCGCPDPNFLEYISDRDCDKTDSCKTAIVFGCTDPMACNYNPNANFPLSILCCYPGYCNDLDISLVCPTLAISENAETIGLDLYPNPTKGELTIEINSSVSNEIDYSIHDCLGKKVFEEKIRTLSGTAIKQIDTSLFTDGIYLLRLSYSDKIVLKNFIKN